MSGNGLRLAKKNPAPPSARDGWRDGPRRPGIALSPLYASTYSPNHARTSRSSAFPDTAAATALPPRSHRASTGSHPRTRTTARPRAPARGRASSTLRVGLRGAPSPGTLPQDANLREEGRPRHWRPLPQAAGTTLLPQAASPAGGYRRARAASEESRRPASFVLQHMACRPPRPPGTQGSGRDI